MDKKFWSNAAHVHHGASFCESPDKFLHPEQGQLHVTDFTTSKPSSHIRGTVGLTIDDLIERKRNNEKDQKLFRQEEGNSTNEPLYRGVSETKELMYSASSYRGSPEFKNSGRFLQGSYAPDTIEKIYSVGSEGDSLQSQQFSLLDQRPGRNYDIEQSSGANISFSRNSPSSYSAAKDTAAKNQNAHSRFEHSESTRISSHYEHNLSNNRSRLQNSYISGMDRRSHASSVDPISRQSRISPTKPWIDDYYKENRNSGYSLAKFLASSHLRNSPTKNNENRESELKLKIQAFDSRLMEIQEELAQSKISNTDPYKMSLRSVNPLPKEEGLDSMSSNNINSHRHNWFEQTNRFEKSQPLSSLDPGDLQNKSKGTESLATTKNTERNLDSKNYQEKFKDMKMRYYNTFLPQESKILNNPYKIWRYRLDAKLENDVKGYLDEFAALQGDINTNLFDSRV